MDLLARILVTIGSTASIGLGIWHFFGPTAWNWYSNIDVGATELIVAVRAINVFFYLSLVLFGALNLLFNHWGRSNRYSMLVMLAATCILWLTGLVLQLVYPQGPINPVLQFGMLSAFTSITLCHLIAPWIRMSWGCRWQWWWRRRDSPFFSGNRLKRSVILSRSMQTRRRPDWLQKQSVQCRAMAG